MSRRCKDGLINYILTTTNYILIYLRMILLYETNSNVSDIKGKKYFDQLSKISKVDDDLFSTDFSQNRNYGIIPLGVIHNIMQFQLPPDLLSMSLSCSLFCKAQNSSYFWKSYHNNFFKTDIESINHKREGYECVNWKKEFVKRYFNLVFAWGFGEYGGCGHGKLENEMTPKLVEKLVPYKINPFCVFCGEWDCSVVVSNGDLLSWGRNKSEKLGQKDEHLIARLTLQLPENRKIIQIVHGEDNSFFLDDFGDIWGCGSNSWGFLTGKRSYEYFHQPIKIAISGSPKITKIVSGDNHFGCICSSGKLYTFGYGNYGKLGHGNLSHVLQPQFVKYLENIRVKDVDMGRYHTILTTEEGKIYSAGYGKYGQMGNGKTSNSSYPLSIKFFFDNSIVITKISCGCSHSGCLDSDGNCYMWGRGKEGEIGNGSFKEINSTPIRISSFIDSSGKKIDLDIPNTHKFVQLECGGYHNIALLESKTENERKTFVLTWGRGEYGQLGLNNNKDVNIPTVVPFFENTIVKSVHSGGRVCAVIL